MIQDFSFDILRFNIFDVQHFYMNGFSIHYFRKIVYKSVTSKYLYQAMLILRNNQSVLFVHPVQICRIRPCMGGSVSLYINMCSCHYSSVINGAIYHQHVYIYSYNYTKIIHSTNCDSTFVGSTFSMSTFFNQQIQIGHWQTFSNYCRIEFRFVTS